MRHPLCHTTSAISYVHVVLNCWPNRQDQSESKLPREMVWLDAHSIWIEINAHSVWTCQSGLKAQCEHSLEDEVLVSFDVVYPYIRILTNVAVRFAHQHLQDDSSLSERTPFTPGEIVSWLEFCRNATYCVFHFAYYQNILGTAIGSPVFIVAANLVVEDVESIALSTYPSHSRSESNMYTKPVVPLKPTL